MGPLKKHARSFAALVAAIVAVLVAGPVFAAEFGSGDTYRLPAGQVIEDDLTVTAQEIYIDGRVDGDLVAMGAYVEINGVVTGDVLAAGAEVRINGVVEDDVRAAGAGVIVTGTIGDHLFAAAGGGEGAFTPMPVSGRSVVQGVRIERGATVGGSAYLFGGEALIDGAIANDLQARAGTVLLNGQVGGDATLNVGRVTFSDTARVGGLLSYTAPEAASIAPGVAGEVRFEQREQPQTTPTPTFRPGQFLRPLLTLAGFALLGWLLLRFTPAALRRPAQALALQPGQAAIYGIAALALLFAVPLVSVLIFLVILLFWGWFPALMFALLLTAALALAWTLSPLITGLWVGQALLRATGREASDFLALCLGVLLIVLLSLIPRGGWLVSLISLVVALGALIAARRGAFDAPITTVAQAPTPV